MSHDIPLYVSLLFILTTVATLAFFYWCIHQAETEHARRKAMPVTFILLAWLLLQGILAYKGVYYTGLDSLPPKIVVLGVLPLFLTIAILFITKPGRRFMDALPLKQITWMHTIRIPVEITLLLLFLYQAVPMVMTFEGRNFDILCGITAPFIVWFGFKGNSAKRGLLLTWNIICLLLLINIIVHAFLSAPTPLQQLAFDQPNIGILYFPYHWLPTFVAPMVLFMHLVALRKLARKH